MSSPKPQPIWIFDNPRTCSQLLHRFFKDHPQLETRTAHQWAIHATMAGPERIQTRVANRPKAIEADQKLQAELIDLFPADKFDITKESYSVAGDRLEAAIQKATGQDKIPYIKEHIVCTLKPSVLESLLRSGTVDSSQLTNPTSIPDSLFSSIQFPLVQARHPALVIPSFYRAQLINFLNDPDEDAFALWTMQRSTRWFFDFLLSQGRKPILIDAEDVVFRSEALCAKLCAIWGIGAGGLAFEWAAREKGQRIVHPLEHYAGALEESKGVIKKTEHLEVDVDVEQKKWEKEFGEETALKLRTRVDEDMADYIYMQQYRLKLEE